MECPVCDEFVVPNPQFHLRRRSGARGDRDASYLGLEELASFSVYLLLQLRR